MRFTIADDRNKKSADVRLIADDSKDRALLRLMYNRVVTLNLSGDGTTLFIEFLAPTNTR
jgi:hypothetical protein